MKNKSKRIFVVDTENTNTFDFIRDYQVSEGDEIILFISTSSKPIKPMDLHTIHSKNITITTILCNSIVKNAMDFQIVTYLTLIASRNPHRKHYVVSDDKSFSSFIEYLKITTPCMVEIIRQEKTTVNIDDDNCIKALLINILEEDYSIDNASDKVIGFDFCNKQALHNQLVQSFGPTGRLIYKQLKTAL